VIVVVDFLKYSRRNLASTLHRVRLTFAFAWAQFKPLEVQGNKSFYLTSFKEQGGHGEVNEREKDPTCAKVSFSTNPRNKQRPGDCWFSPSQKVLLIRCTIRMVDARFG
jgi:hypothetical protein